MIAEPLEKGLDIDIESGLVNMDWDKKRISDFFQVSYSVPSFLWNRTAESFLIFDMLLLPNSIFSW